MKPQVDSGLPPKVLMDKIYNRLRFAYMRVSSSNPGDVKNDANLLMDIEAMEVYMQQLTFAYMKKVYDDSGRVEAYEELKELEEILTDIAKGKKESIKREKHIRKNASHIASLVHRRLKKGQYEGTIKFQEILKERAKLKAEEKEAREKMGKKAA